MTTLYLEEGHQEIVNDGEVMAVRQRGKVEVWHADGEYCFGTLPETATADDVAHAVRFHQAGFRLGERVGKAAAREAMRSALGL